MAVTTTDYALDYVNRAAFLADGWSFTATTAAAAPRDTESGTASYNPLSTRISGGDLETGTSTVQDMMFRDLPAAWSSVTVTFSFAVGFVNFRVVGLGIYTNDANHVDAVMMRDYTTFASHNDGGSTDTLEADSTGLDSSGSMLRITRDIDEETLSFYSSTDGTTWNHIHTGVFPTLGSKLALYAAGNTGGIEAGTWDHVSVDAGWPDELDEPVLVLDSRTPPTTVGGTDGQAVISWGAIDGADTYEVSLADGLDATTGFVLVDDDATSPYLLGGLAAGDYTAQVVAVPPA